MGYDMILAIGLIIILLEVSQGFASNKWKNRVSIFPEQCSGLCHDGVIFDFMLKPGKVCPGSISEIETKKKLFIEDNAEVCNIIVSFSVFLKI